MYVLAWALLTLQESNHGPKIADAREPRGPVSIARDEQALETRQVARRVVNGDLYDSDRISTGESGSVDIMFADDSRVSLEAGTQVVIEQRNLRQAEGPRSIGRRIQILAGRISSDIVPSADIQTEFVTPAGTAAIRGTLVDIGVAGVVEVFIDMGDGVFRLPGGQAAFPMPAGTHAQYTFNPADNTLQIQNLDLQAATGDPMIGRVGEADVRVQPGGSITLQATPDGFQVVDASGAQILDPNGAWVDLSAGTAIPAADEPLFDTGDALVPADEGGANPAASDTSSLDSIGSEPFADTGGAADIAQSLGTAIGPVVIDDFNRADASTIGNGWVEEVIGGSASFAIADGRAEILLGGAPSEAQFRRDIGHLGTFDISARFTYNGDIEIVFDVNFDPVLDLGIGMVYFPTSAILDIEDGAGNVSSFGAANGVLFVPANEPFVMQLRFDGSTICAHMLHEADGHTFDVCVSGTNGPGSHVAIEASNSILSGQSITVDDITRHPAP